jgi:hypothetical protein
MPTPGAFLGPQETIRASIAQGTLFAYPRIHSLWHIVSHPRSLLGPYGMGHCQPPGFHGLWNIRAILADGIVKEKVTQIHKRGHKLVFSGRQDDVHIS